jgi:hypothetical protein
VDGFDGLAGLGRQDGNRLQGVAVVLPALPEARDSERLVVCQTDAVGLLGAARPLAPLVEVAGEDQTPALPERVAERPVLRGRLRPRVDGSRGRLGAVGASIARGPVAALGLRLPGPGVGADLEHLDVVAGLLARDAPITGSPPGSRRTSAPPTNTGGPASD